MSFTEFNFYNSSHEMKINSIGTKCHDVLKFSTKLSTERG